MCSCRLFDFAVVLCALYDYTMLVSFADALPYFGRRKLLKWKKNKAAHGSTAGELHIR
jgi:hypothetical protein